MQHDDGTGNFTATNDGRPGNPSTTNTGYDYAQGLIWSCNSCGGSLPAGNQRVAPATPTLSTTLPVRK